MATAAIVTEKEVMEMTLPQLRELGTSLGLTAISRTSKEVLQQVVLDKLEESTLQKAEEIEEESHDEIESVDQVEGAEKTLATRKKRHIEVFMNDEHRRILENNNLSKSEKMRKLWRKNMSIADIHRVLDTHYSFTYGVIDRYRKILGKD